MEDTLKEKIDSLPESLREQVSDYIDFLLYQYGNKSEPVLTPENKSELDERWETYQQDGSSANNLEEVKDRLEKKYGLSD